MPLQSEEPGSGVSATPSSLPEISVVIPTYNRCASLGVTLDALDKQEIDQQRYEVIVVSDGSTDGTDTLLDERAARAPYCLRSIRQENGGPARARNRGVAEARGSLIVFLDDDVEPGSDFLSIHAELHAAPGAERLAVIGPMVQAPDRRWHEPVWVAWEHAMLEKQYAAWREGIWKGVGPNHFYTGNASLRREHLVSVGGFNEAFKRQEDVELAHRLSRGRQVTFAFDPRVTVLHRPVRSFTSWLAIPYAYGQLDVKRAQNDAAAGQPGTWDLIRRQTFTGRNRITQLCVTGILASLGTRASSGSTPLSTFVRAVALFMARMLYALRRPGIAFALLSLAYNLRYLDGVLAGLPSADALRSVVKGQPVRNSEPRKAPVIRARAFGGELREERTKS